MTEMRTNGKVLIVGGFGPAGFLASAEIFDPNTGEFRSTGSLATARASHTATVLADSTVLIAGGENAGGLLNTAEIYNSATESFAPEAVMTSPRASHIATRLPDGRVLVAGGVGPNTTQSNSFGPTEIFASGFLAFPLRNKTPFTAAINTVFDHSMDQEYCPDGVVKAYTGEEGRSDFGVSHFSVSFRSCHHAPLHGFKQDILGTAFSVGGQYVGNEDTNKQCCFLFYDGHPGYDYRTTDQLRDGSLCTGGTPCSAGRTDVVAAAEGIVTCARMAGCPEGPGEVRIDHGNGYSTIYLHLSRIDVDEGTQVSQEQVIGLSGATGASGNPHLHFEVRLNAGGILVPVDPYGWSGSGVDPYTRARNIRLWR